MSLEYASVDWEYEKNKELKKEDVVALMNWAEKQPHLPRMSELDAILFLHSCYYSNETAKTTIDTFYTARALCPEFFADRNPKSNNFKNVFQMLFAPLPKLTPKGEQIIYIRLYDTNPDIFSFNKQVKCWDMVTSLILHQNGTATGHMLLIDMKGFTFSHFTKLGILPMKKFFFYLQEAIPIRMIGMHFINIVSFMDKVLALMKPFMKKELLEGLHLHPNMSATLHEFIPKECLPQDYSGTAPSIADLHKQMTANIVANADYFVAEEKQIVDEKKRPGKPKNAGDLFGVEGTFKKLDID